MLFFFVSCKTSINETSLDKECNPVILNFFSTIQNGKYHQALENLLTSNLDINLKDTNTLLLVSKFDSINSLSGSFIGYEIVRKRQVGKDLAIYSCLVKYQKKFYRFVFVFYRAETTALLYKFTFDDSIDIELEESLKFYIQ